MTEPQDIPPPPTDEPPTGWVQHDDGTWSQYPNQTWEQYQYSPPAPPVTPTSPVTPGAHENAVGALEPKNTKKKPILPFFIGGGVLVALGLFIGGVISGWLLSNQIAASQALPVTDLQGAPPAPQSGEDVLTVPDVRGLESADARQILADSGFDPLAITVQMIPWAGEPGVVVAQDPVVGEILQNTIVLSVSEPALMPELEGKPKADAIRELSLLGAQTQIVEEFKPTVPTGTVISQDVEPGEPLPLSVELVVSQSGSAVFLADLQETDDSSRCYISDVQINGQAFVDAMQCSARSRDPAVYAWALGRHATLFTAVAGISDSSAPTTTATLTVLTDGKQVYSTTLTHGSSQTIEVDLTGVLRLEMQISTEERADVYLADAQVKGTAAKIDLLTDAP